MNHEAEPKRYSKGTSFHGAPNAGTDEVIQDIRDITRPYLNSHDRTSPSSPTKRAAERNRSKLAAAERRILGADGELGGAGADNLLADEGAY
jgi:hypothetical protein